MLRLRPFFTALAAASCLLAAACSDDPTSKDVSSADTLSADATADLSDTLSEDTSPADTATDTPSEDTSPADTADTSPADTAADTVGVEDGYYVELTWDTPGDPDQTDFGIGMGSDMSLHLRHPDAVGATSAEPGILINDLDGDGTVEGWFTNPYDCYWGAQREWGGKAENDDRDGGGPEIITLEGFDMALTYRIGVDYFTDNGFGDSTATVRVFDVSLPTTQPVFEATLEMTEGDFWEVAEIVGPTREVRDLATSGAPLLTHGVTAQP